MNSITIIFSSAPKQPSPVETVGKAIDKTFNGKHTQKGEYVLSSNSAKGINEISVLSSMINEVNEKGETLKNLTPSDRLLMQISRTVIAIYERFEKTQDTGNVIATIAHTQFRSQKSVLAKLPKFIETNYCEIKELQTLKETKPADYNQAIKPLSTETRNAVNALVNLNLKDLEPIRRAPALQQTSASPISAKIDKEESEEKELEKEAGEPKQAAVTADHVAIAKSLKMDLLTLNPSATSEKISSTTVYTDQEEDEPGFGYSAFVRTLEDGDTQGEAEEGEELVPLTAKGEEPTNAPLTGSEPTKIIIPRETALQFMDNTL